MMKSLTIFLVLNYCFCAEVDFKISLSDSEPSLQLDCSYNLADGEKLDQVSIKKDGQEFIQYDDSNKDDPKFTKIDGIPEVDKQGGCKLTIKNIDNMSSGLYSLIVFYTKKGVQKTATKKFKVSFNSKGCVRDDAWKEGVTASTLPSNVVTIYSLGPTGYIGCRAHYDGWITPGYVTSGGDGCVFSYNGDIKTEQTFDVLIDSAGGFKVETFNTNNGIEIPENSFKVGKDKSGPVYFAVCRSTSFHGGKISDKLYYIEDNAEKTDCPQYDIVVCS